MRIPICVIVTIFKKEEAQKRKSAGKAFSVSLFFIISLVAPFWFFITVADDEGEISLSGGAAFVGILLLIWVPVGVLLFFIFFILGFVRFLNNLGRDDSPSLFPDNDKGTGINI